MRNTSKEQHAFKLTRKRKTVRNLVLPFSLSRTDKITFQEKKRFLKNRITVTKNILILTQEASKTG